MNGSVRFMDLGASTDELRPALESAFLRVMRSGRYVLGDETRAFEKEFAAFCGVTDCVGVGNGLDAIHLILRAMDIGPGDEVLVPSNTYIATWLAVSHCGATPIAVEPDPATYNITAEGVAAAITSRTRAVIPVHLYGQPADMQSISEVARKAGLRVIEDAAQAHGARYDGKRAGALADAAAFSFYPSKNLGALGDGGCVVTDDAAIAASVRRLANYGSGEKYIHDVAGFNSRLDELQSAFLRAKLPFLDHWNQRRRRLAARYLENLRGANVILPTVVSNAVPVWHLFVVRVLDRKKVVAALQAAGIETQIHYPIAPGRSGAYSEWARQHNVCPVADQLSNEVLSLPMSPQMSIAEVDRVCSVLVQTLDS